MRFRQVNVAAARSRSRVESTVENRGRIASMATLTRGGIAKLAGERYRGYVLIRNSDHQAADWYGGVNRPCIPAAARFSYRSGTTDSRARRASDLPAQHRP